MPQNRPPFGPQIPDPRSGGRTASHGGRHEAEAAPAIMSAPQAVRTIVIHQMLFHPSNSPSAQLHGWECSAPPPPLPRLAGAHPTHVLAQPPSPGPARLLFSVPDWVGSQEPCYQSLLISRDSPDLGHAHLLHKWGCSTCRSPLWRLLGHPSKNSSPAAQGGLCTEPLTIHMPHSPQSGHLPEASSGCSTTSPGNRLPPTQWESTL